MFYRIEPDHSIVGYVIGGIEHPRFFETLVFGGAHLDRAAHYGTYAEAVTGHQAMVLLLNVCSCRPCVESRWRSRIEVMGLGSERSIEIGGDDEQG